MSLVSVQVGISVAKPYKRTLSFSPSLSLNCGVNKSGCFNWCY